MIVDTTDARLVVVDHGTSVELRMRGGSVLVSTAIEANQLADLLRKAAWHLDEASRLRGTREDEVAARGTNAAFEAAHKEWPGGTLAPAYTKSSVVHIPIDACECTRTVLCEEHRGGAA